MNAPKIWKWVPALVVCGVMGAAWAKLPPAPPADPEKAAAAKQKAAEAAQKAKEAQAKAEDRVVEHYKKSKGMMGAAKAAPTAAAAKK